MVCRRERGVVVAAPRSDASRGFPLSRAFVAVVGVGAVALASIGFAARPGAPAPVLAMREPVVRPQLKAARADDGAKARADDLAASLRKLEQAEAERRELERKLAQTQAEARATADSERKREELERDKKRHEMVQKDLDALALKSARRNVSITMYSTSWCGSCIKARSYMQAHGIAFTELDVDRDATAKARARGLNPRGSVPTIAIDSEVLVGFSPESLEQRITRAAKKRAGS